MQVGYVVAPAVALRSSAIDTAPPVTGPPQSPTESARGEDAAPVSSPWQVLVDRPDHNLAISTMLFRSRMGSILWLIVRLWLGYEWLNAGYQKIWGAERSAFWFGGGTAVKGFATAGILGSTAGKGGASYGWWAGFLHNFVVPNASWIAKLVALGEVLIGVGLIVGLFTGVAAFAGLLLNLTYMFSGTAGVNPAYAILGVLLVLAWRNAGWIGLDRFVLRNTWRPDSRNIPFGRMARWRIEVEPKPS